MIISRTQDNPGVGGAQVDPVLGREVVEGEQLLDIIGDLGDRLAELGLVGGLEPGHGVEGVAAILGVPDLREGFLRAGMRGLRERAEHVCDLSGEGLARCTTSVLVSSPSPSNRA
jgi:hypothetical protein